MKRRGNSEEQIEKRLALAREEMAKEGIYKEMVLKKGGMIFEIESDEDMYAKVIPAILELG